MIKVFKDSFELAHQIFPRGGSCLEFGVYVGQTFVWQAKRIQKTHEHSTLIGFDSWQGLPEEEHGVWAPSRHMAGKYSSAKDIVLEKLRGIHMAQDSRIRFVDGFFSESLTEDIRKKIDNVIFINIDVDIYKSTIELLDFVKPLLRPGVVIYWDDWKDPKDVHEGDWGEHLAWDNWNRANPDIEAETIEVNPLNQRYMVISKANGKTLESEGLSLYKIRQSAFAISNENPTLTDRAKKVAKKILGR